MGSRFHTEGRPSIHIPAASEDRPSWRRVALLAAAGFVVGIVWPRLVGIRLGPTVPDSATPGGGVSSEPPAAGGAPVGASPASSSPGAAAAAPSAGVPAAIVSPAASSAATAGVAGEAPSVTVSHGSVTSCRTAGGDALKAAECGGLASFDGIVMPRLRKLADCPSAGAASGKLRLVVTADFSRGTLGVDVGRSGVGAAADGLLACARANLSGASLAAVGHDHPRYTVTYAVTFASDAGGSSGAPAAASAPTPVPPAADTSGEATAEVAWDVALVRDLPKTGKIVARLQKGSTVRLGPAKDGWYPVRFGDGFSGEGWVYRGAIGR